MRKKRLPWWLSGKGSICDAGDLGLIPGLGRSPGGEGMATHSNILAWRIPWQRSLVGYSPWSCKESNMTEQLSIAHDNMYIK